MLSMGRNPSEETTVLDPTREVVIGIDDIADGETAEAAPSEPSPDFAQGSDVHDIEDLERQLGAVASLDAALLAYLDHEEAPSRTPSAPAVAVTVPRLPPLVVRTDDRRGPRRR